MHGEITRHHAPGKDTSVQHSPNILRSVFVAAVLVGVGMNAGCKTGSAAGSPPMDAKTIFLADVRAKGITVQEELPDGRVVLVQNGFSITIVLDNVTREFNQTHDPEVVHQFVRSLDGRWPEALTWERAKPNLLYIAEQAAMETGDSIKAPVAGNVIKVLEHFDSKHGELRFITPKDFKDWNVTQQQVDAVVEKNMTAFVSEHAMHLRNEGPVHFAWLDCPETPSQASLFLSEGFKKGMKATLSLPVYVALPSRGALYIIPAKNKSQIPMLRQEVLDAYKQDSHPLTTEVFEVSDSGIRVYKDLAENP
ncbi:MAG TPA: hypothetical protein VKU00_03475 [Chthonomonadaceae bacterium]|nr:hypothetical protein [Chthonomonadaceae bacterium]